MSAEWREPIVFLTDNVQPHDHMYCNNLQYFHKGMCAWVWDNPQQLSTALDQRLGGTAIEQNVINQVITQALTGSQFPDNSCQLQKKMNRWTSGYIL